MGSKLLSLRRTRTLPNGSFTCLATLIDAPHWLHVPALGQTLISVGKNLSARMRRFMRRSLHAQRRRNTLERGHCGRGLLGAEGLLWQVVNFRSRQAASTWYRHV